MLGGNEVNTQKLFGDALALIQKEIGAVVKVSGIYITTAWGPIPQPDFLNRAVLVNSIQPPVILLKKLLSIETRLGRKRILKFGPRSIDIDMLFYGQLVIRNKDLVLPHPQIQNRRFVLLPCNEIVPKYRHPVLGMTIHELLQDCKDQLEVNKWSI